MRIAVLDRDRCQPKNCSQECIKYCPRVRTGDETIIMDKKPIINEELCIGCGICVHKCPFKAIHIEKVAEELDEEIVHQFGKNAFRLFRMAIPREGKVVGILGKNGTGKTTALQILAGKLKPNFGEWNSTLSWEEICDELKGTEMHDYFEKIGEIKMSLKPQYIEDISFDLAEDFLIEIDEKGILTKIIKELELKEVLNKNSGEISGGDLQLIAIAVALMKNADVYFFDEPSSYLDIYHRLKIARLIRNLATKKMVMVVEHDLAVMDFLADIAHLIYGKEGIYGVMTKPMKVRHAINTYLSGYLKEENMRFGEKIRFESHPPKEKKDMVPLLTFDLLKKDFNHFSLEVGEGTIHEGEVIGIVGANSLGKTTFVKILAGIIEPTEGKVESVKVSYKPQYIKPIDGTVEEIISSTPLILNFYSSSILKPLKLDRLLDRELKELSGGELQRVAIALCLSRNADIYLIDEPSAYLDSSQRMIAAKVIRRIMEKKKKSALIVDHDVYFVDMVSDSLMVFLGEPGIEGKGEGPFDLRTGMNEFLKSVGITFRRDEESNRPRVNKPDSRLDREQKASGEYYYDLHQ